MFIWVFLFKCLGGFGFVLRRTKESTAFTREKIRQGTYLEMDVYIDWRIRSTNKTALFSFINDLDKGIESLSLHVQMILNWAEELTYWRVGRKALQRDPFRLDQWADASGMQFSKAKCQVLFLGHNNPKKAAGLGKSGWKLPDGKGSRGVGQQLLQHEPVCAQVAKKVNSILAQQQCGQQDQVSSTSEAASQTLYSVWGLSLQEGC